MSRRSAPSTRFLGPWPIRGVRSRVSSLVVTGGQADETDDLAIETQGAGLMRARFAAEICRWTRPRPDHEKAAIYISKTTC